MQTIKPNESRPEKPRVHLGITVAFCQLGNMRTSRSGPGLNQIL
jgi:hypothetical protein